MTEYEYVYLVYGMLLGVILGQISVFHYLAKKGIY